MRKAIAMIHSVSKKPAAAYAAVFSLCAALFAWVQSYPAFRDPDSFYHAKMAEQLLHGNIVSHFPWLPFTTLGAAFADHHFLYHLVLAPFIAVLGPTYGTVVATVILAATAVTVFHAFLRDREVPFAWVFTAVLVTSSGFLFRIDLAKAIAVSVAILFGALILMRRGNSGALFFVAWAYVWAYGGWPVLGVICAAELGARLLVDIASYGRTSLHVWWRELPTSRELRNAIAVAAGFATGIVINPYFPNNLRFYWEQIVQIAVINYRGTIGVGSEWYPYKFLEIFGEAGGVFILAATCILLLLLGLFWSKTVAAEEQSLSKEGARGAASLFILAATFFFMTMRSRRHIEYFMPFSVAACALVAAAILAYVDAKKLSAEVVKTFGRVASVIIGCLFALGFAVLAWRSVTGVHKAFGRGYAWSKYAEASAWLSANTAPGSVVVHSDWDEFPILFFHNDHNAYIAGLDPTFLYRNDPTRYRRWVDLTLGKTRKDIAALVIGTFNSRFVFIDKKHKAMHDAVAGDPGMALVYEDRDAWIYTVLTP
jgi:hypothetical protein